MAFSSCHACCKEDVLVLFGTPLLGTEALSAALYARQLLNVLLQRISSPE